MHSLSVIARRANELIGPNRVSNLDIVLEETCGDSLRVPGRSVGNENLALQMLAILSRNQRLTFVAWRGSAFVIHRECVSASSKPYGYSAP